MNRGFTLIEAVVYIGLFGLFMGGAMMAAYNIFESSGRGETRVLLQEEGDFLIAKISSALVGAKEVTFPAAGASGAVLSADEYDTVIGTLAFSISGSNMELKRGALAPIILNNSNVQVSNLLFAHTLGSGAGINPESVTASFTLTARAQNGASVSQDFSVTNYLRR